MSSHNDERQTASIDEPKRPRFRIERLEERIAPTHRLGHYPRGQGQCGWGGEKVMGHCQ